jgi:molybdopterin molybdotransferase
MIAFDVALRLVLRHTKRQGAGRVSLGESAGCVLAKDIKADRDLPPFHRATMDGYAVPASDAQQVRVTLTVQGTITPGVVARERVKAGHCMKIMTGAPLPAGADAVVMVEDSEPADKGCVYLRGPVEKWQNVARQGEDIRKDSVVLRHGTIIDAAVNGLLAALGAVSVPVYRPPRMAVLITGEEVVAPSATPKPSEIRDSNSTIMASRLRELPVTLDLVGTSPDNRRTLRWLIQHGLKHDVVLISGGISMGDRDYVPGVLGQLGARIIVHRVAIKPGRPFLFARGPKGQYVFGLPGNPVSVLVCMEEFVMPALRKMLGYETCVPTVRRAVLTAAYTKPADRMHFALAHLWWRQKRLYATPVDSHGSGDLVSATRANGVILVPRRERKLAAGSIVRAHFFGGAGFWSALQKPE